MESLNVVEHISSCLIVSAIASVVYALSFQYPEEALTGGIITTVANRAHATDQAVAA